VSAPGTRPEVVARRCRSDPDEIRPIAAPALRGSRVLAKKAPPMSNRAIWNVRQRHEWLSKLRKGKRMKLRQRLRIGLEQALERKRAKLAKPAETPPQG
jgi:hypothetical protein